MLNVGGWFDAEDPMGPLHMYRSIEKNSPRTDNRLVMGPWSHGGWSRGEGSRLGNLEFAVKTGEHFRKDIQFPWFMHHLKDAPLPAGLREDLHVRDRRQRVPQAGRVAAGGRRAGAAVLRRRTARCRTCAGSRGDSTST